MSLSLQGLPIGGHAGCPALPQQPIKILLPPDALAHTASLSLRDAATEGMAGTWKVRPSSPPIGPDGPVWPEGRTIVDGHDVAVYATDAFYPASHLDLPRHGLLRHWKLAMVSIVPFRHNPVSGKLEVLRSGQLVVRFRRDPAELERFAREPKVLSVQAQRSRAKRRRDLRESVVNFREMVVAYEEVDCEGTRGGKADER